MGAYIDGYLDRIRWNNLRDEYIIERYIQARISEGH